MKTSSKDKIKKASHILRQLGIPVSDAEGRMRPLKIIMLDLENALRKLPKDDPLWEYITSEKDGDFFDDAVC